MWLPKDRLEHGFIPRHRHAQAYAALVLSGRYEEAGDSGRFLASAGDVLCHRSHEAHQNFITTSEAVVLNLPVPSEHCLPPAFKIADPDAFLKDKHLDMATAFQALNPIEIIRPLDRDWPDQLARELTSDPALSIQNWAAMNGLAAATVSRGFRKTFGITPIRFRAEARARRAVEALLKGNTSLASLACDLDFADQPHMTRAVRSIVNASPAKWRKVNSIQEKPE